MPAKASKGAKAGRNKVKCDAYKASGRREKRKKANLNRQALLMDRPDDEICAYALDMRRRYRRAGRDNTNTQAQRQWSGVEWRKRKL